MSKIDKYIKNRIIHGNCIDILKNIESNSVDVVFADPPYNLQLQNPLNRPNNTSVDGVKDTWDKFESFEKYDSFNRAWLYESRRVLKGQSCPSTGETRYVTLSRINGLASEINSAKIKYRMDDKK